MREGTQWMLLALRVDDEYGVHAVDCDTFISVQC